MSLPKSLGFVMYKESVENQFTSYKYQIAVLP